MTAFSVLLSVYENDNATHFESALNSIWPAQSLKPTQVVIVKDGPLTKALEAVVANWKLHANGVVTEVPLKQNVGLARALNSGLKACHYDLVARMDSDDISAPDRFEKQVEFMRQNPSVDVLGSWMEVYDETLTRCTGVRRTPVVHENILKYAKRRSPMNHISVMFRKSAVESVGGYPDFRKAQDYALWSLMLTEGFKFHNLPESLVQMRAGTQLYKRRDLKYLQYEKEILDYQLRLRFISRTDYVLNLTLRGLSRISPKKVKGFLYGILN